MHILLHVYTLLGKRSGFIGLGKVARFLLKLSTNPVSNYTRGAIRTPYFEIKRVDPSRARPQMRCTVQHASPATLERPSAIMYLYTKQLLVEDIVLQRNMYTHMRGMYV